MTDGVKTRRKLIEVALPLEAINAASAREKAIRHGHPSNLHRWWARRPLATARAVIFAQMVDDPSAVPELFPTEKAQQKERARLFRILEDLVKWENTTNEQVLQRARDEIWESWRRACADNADHPLARDLFDRHKLPAFHDPFAGGGSLPLEAQRLGLEAYASDLNPVAVLINKAMVEIPPKFAGKSPVNPTARADRTLIDRRWPGVTGLADDVRYYGRWMRDEAEKRLGHLYPKIEISSEMAAERADLAPLVGKQFPVIAWLWARTVCSPNPAFASVEVPLVSSFILSNKPGKQAYVQPIVENGGYRFAVRMGQPRDIESASHGTKLSRGANFRCLMSDAPMTPDHIKSEGLAGRMGARLMAIVAEGERGRIYLPPTKEQELAAQQAKPTWKPDAALPNDPRNFWTVQYGLATYADLFTPRQLVALSTFSDLVEEARVAVLRDAVSAGMHEDARGRLASGGTGAEAYADAVAVYLGLAISKAADSNSSLCPWEPVAQCTRQVFGRQAIPMLWDFGEANPLHDSSGGLTTNVEVSVRALDLLPASSPGAALQLEAQNQNVSAGKVVSTDPPYYDNVAYADLSDFFHVWLRRSLKGILPTLFSTMASPKDGELVATPYRHGGKSSADAFFLKGMTGALGHTALAAHPVYPVTIYYAFKQSETDTGTGTSSTGWETFLDAVIRSGLAINGTWPMRSEMTAALKASSNYLATSVVLACRPASATSPVATLREFIGALRAELPLAMSDLQRGNVAPVDMAQASIGPGMAIYTRYSSVLEASGRPLRVGEALKLINQTLDEVQTEQEGDFDSYSRWALAWFESCGFTEGEYGLAETLSKAKNTSVQGLTEAGLLDPKSPGGKVRLLRPNELPTTWDPATDKRLTDWEILHHLIRVLGSGGEAAAAELASKVGSRAEAARELCYRLYTICERKKRAADALSYNTLVQSWPEIMRLARDGAGPQVEQGGLFE